MNWIGVDLDGTLALYDGWKGIDHIGEPIPNMVRFVSHLLATGNEVRIFTARMSGSEDEQMTTRLVVGDWTEKHFGQRLQATCIKDFNMLVLYDDRAVQVDYNEGTFTLSKGHR